MRVVAQVEQFHLLDADRHHHEVVRDGSILREFLREGRCGFKGLSWMRPSPQGSSTGRQGSPLGLVWRGRHLCSCSPKPVLLLGFRQQPAEFHLGLMVQLCDFAAAAIRIQLQLIRSVPAAEHQRSHPGGAIRGHGGELQPAGTHLAAFALEGTAKSLPPGGQGSIRRCCHGLK